MPHNKNEVVESSGNVAQLGTQDAGETLVKANLAGRIMELIEHRHLSQASAARILNVDQPELSALKRGRVTRFSLGRLTRFLLLLAGPLRAGHVGVVKNRPKSRKRAHLRAA